MVQKTPKKKSTLVSVVGKWLWKNRQTILRIIFLIADFLRKHG